MQREVYPARLRPIIQVPLVVLIIIASSALASAFLLKSIEWLSGVPLRAEVSQAMTDDTDEPLVGWVTDRCLEAIQVSVGR